MAGRANDLLYANYAGVHGSNRSDLFGDAGNATIYGDDGDDALEDGNGRNFLYGGLGNDLTARSGTPHERMCGCR
jgi:Ca2+-binding RTX toxin-like protein